MSIILIFFFFALKSIWIQKQFNYNYINDSIYLLHRFDFGLATIGSNVFKES